MTIKTLETKASSDLQTCVVCGISYSVKGRLENEGYQALHPDKKYTSQINPVDCCDNACFMTGLSLKISNPHFKY